METLKILIMGAPSVLRRELERQLRQAGHCVETLTDTREGVQRAADFLPDVVFLDQRLPEAENLEVCRRIRSEVPPSQEPAYVLLPRLFFADSRGRGQPVLSKRLEQVQTLLGIAPGGAPTSRNLQLSIGGLEMDLRRHEASLDGRSLSLTPIEFRLLWTIASDPNNVHDRQQLGQRCRDHQNVRRERTIDVHIKSLRTKLGERADLIQTVHGLGYRWKGAAPSQG